MRSPIVAAGQEMTPKRQALIDQWDGIRHAFAPTPEEIDESIATMRGNAGEVLEANIKEAAAMHVQAVPFMLFCRPWL